MSAINFVVRDVAGNISRGSVAGEGSPASILVGSGAEVSLNLTRGQILSYTRQGQALEITLIDGRVIVIEGYFNTDGASENQLFLSADGFLTEVDLTQGAGADYFASYTDGDGAVGKFAVDDDLSFMRSSDVMLADAGAVADDEVGMLGAALGGIAPLVGLGGVAAVAGVTAVVAGVDGDDDDDPAGPEVVITGGTDGTGDIVNEDDYTDGVEVTGEGTPDAVVDVTIDGTTETTTVTEDGTWEVVFDPEDIDTGEYDVPVEVTITDDTGTATVTDTLVVDTLVEVTADATGGDDGIINGTEHDEGVTLTGTVTGGDTVIVTIADTDYEATVTDDTWSLELDDTVLVGGEYDLDVTVTATDTAGNSTTTDATIVVDTQTGVTLDLSGVGGDDNVVNSVEHDGGVTLTGTAESGASVVVTLGTVVQTVTATVDGTWSSTFVAADVPTGELDLPVTVEATDIAGNTATATGSVTIDTETSVTLDTTSVGGTDMTVNGTEQGDGVTLTGTAQAGSSVEVTFGTVTQTVIATADGTWSATYDASDVPTGELDVPVSVVATDGAGNTASATGNVAVDTTTSVTIDTSAIGGSDNVVNGAEQPDGVTLTGTAQPGASVVVSFGTITQTVVATADGTWSATYAGSDVPTGELDVDVSAVATDSAGNTATATGSVAVDTTTSVTVDTAAVGGSDQVLNGAEQESGVTVTGTAQAGATVVVTLGTVSQTVTATAGGTWSATYDAADVPTGEYDLPVNVVATDAAGNSATATGSVTVDTFVNDLEVTSNSTGGSDGVVNFDERGDAITMEGTVEAGSSVSVNLNGVVMPATVDANGNWTVSYPAGTLPAGEYDTTVTVTATDAAGNTSSLSEPVTVDTVAGDLALSTQPIEIDDVVNLVEQSDGVIISGTATAGLTVTVGLGTATQTVVAQPDGTWSVNFPPSMVPEGTYESAITASITDAAGNYREVSDTVQIDTEVVPFNFSTDPVEGDGVINATEIENGFVLSGQVEANSSVTVVFQGETVTVNAGANGEWSAGFNGSNIIDGEFDATATATAIDPAGNVSVVEQEISIDNIVNTLTVNDPVEGDNVVDAIEAADGITLGGTVEAGSTVMVTFQTITREATVDAAGNWTVTYAGSEVPAGEYEANVTIAATDAFGNTDSITDTFLVDTVAPDAPGIDSVVVTPRGVTAITIDAPEDDVTVSEVTSSHSVNELADQGDAISLGGDSVIFSFDTALPNGSHLVVSEADAAGNSNSTYVVLEETGTNAVDLGGLSGFDIGAIDLGFAQDADLVLDLATIEGLSDVDNNLIIHGSDADSDSVTILGATDTNTTRDVGDHTYDVYTLGDDAEILIEDGINVTI